MPYLFSKGEVLQGGLLPPVQVVSLLARVSTPQEPYLIPHYNFTNVMPHDSPRGEIRNIDSVQHFGNWGLRLPESMGLWGRALEKFLKNTSFCNKK